MAKACQTGPRGATCSLFTRIAPLLVERYRRLMVFSSRDWWYSRGSVSKSYSTKRTSATWRHSAGEQAKAPQWLRTSQITSNFRPTPDLQLSTTTTTISYLDITKKTVWTTRQIIKKKVTEVGSHARSRPKTCLSQHSLVETLTPYHAGGAMACRGLPCIFKLRARLPRRDFPLTNLAPPPFILCPEHYYRNSKRETTESFQDGHTGAYPPPPPPPPPAPHQATYVYLPRHLRSCCCSSHETK